MCVTDLFMCMTALPASMYSNHMHAWGPQMSRESRIPWKEKCYLVLHRSATLCFTEPLQASCHPAPVDPLAHSFIWEDQVPKAASCTEVRLQFPGYVSLFSV